MIKIFISNFDSSTNISSIAALFERYGDVAAVRIRQGQKRVYGIVEMPHDSDAEEAIKELDRTDWEGQFLQVMESKW